MCQAVTHGIMLRLTLTGPGMRTDVWERLMPAEASIGTWCERTGSIRRCWRRQVKRTGIAFRGHHAVQYPECTFVVIELNRAFTMRGTWQNSCDVLIAMAE